ncbi:MAG: dihydroorotate dehydrogenase electron transfer subunit [Clostridiales bacterium]|nr:dihydroorotate dehydrogenase electron transfer subunit [Clostridiales bacterium]MDY4172589.1 dihydroorotate dehydrogenase electron transfer subunit [Evtepia sp.]
MKRSLFTILKNEMLAPATFRMVLGGDTTAITAPGQFVNIALTGKFLRRPISVCDWEGENLTLIYKVVGQGTAQMSRMVPGESLDLLTGLGNGYNLEKSGDKPLLIGGGAGIPPLYALAKKLIAQGKTPSVILGFNKKDELFLEKEFKALGIPVTVATADGSLGVKGFVTDAMPEAGYTYLYTCGPEPMLRAIDGKAASSGQFSFEERMGCGFGACMGCTCKTKYGNKRICREGPVLEREEIIW